MNRRRDRAPSLRQALTERLAGDPAGAAAMDFVSQAAKDAAPDDIPELSAEDLAANLADFWRAYEKRRGPSPAIRIVPVKGPAGEDFDRLEIVQDDAPFLVRSVMGELAEQGVAIRALFHPVVEVRRGRLGTRGESGRLRRESMIQAIVDAVGQDREAAILEGVKATLADVRAAVEDFEATMALFGRTLAELKLRAGPHGDPGEQAAFLEWLQAEHFVFLGARTYSYPR